ncbi:MAG: DpnD protein [Clostridia bacterium]|nr:DpnD protein [Clostridia bacterium]
MSKVYQIEIEETLQRVVKIEANSLDEAIDIAQNRYSNQEYVLDYEDYKGVEYREYKDEVIKEKKYKERER